MSLKTEDLCFERRGFKLGPLEIDLPPGKRSVLLGPSGCGKTTLLRLIAGLEVPRSGKLFFGGRLLAGGGAFVPPGKRSAAMVFQNLALWPHMTAEAQIRYTGRCSVEEARSWLQRVGLSGMERRRPGELSGGENQRLALARALAQGPEILLLDEPLRSVDPHLREDLQGLIMDLCGACPLTTVLVTHDREEALCLGEHLVLMKEGQAVEQGPLDELFDRPRTCFTARFLRGAVLFPIQKEDGRAVGPFGSHELPAELADRPRLFQALSPGDLQPGGAGPEVEVLSRRHGREGLLGEGRLLGQSIHFPLGEEVRVGQRVSLGLRRPPVFVFPEAER